METYELIDTQQPREMLEEAIYSKLVDLEPPLNEWQRRRLRERARLEVESILIAQSLLTARKDQKARQRECIYGGDIDLCGPALGRSPDVDAD